MASLNPDGLYKIEFPDFDAKFYCPSGFEDLSYHNDVMPHAGKRMKIDGKDIEINIWQDYEDKTKREYDNTPRYIFQIILDGDIIKEFKTDSLLQIKMYVGNLDNMLLALLQEINEMSDIKNIINKIIEGADVRSTLSEVNREYAGYNFVKIANFLIDSCNAKDLDDLPRKKHIELIVKSLNGVPEILKNYLQCAADNN